MALDDMLLHDINRLFQEERKVRRFRKHDYLFQEGERAAEVFFVQTGKIQVSKLLPDGRELAIRIVRPDNLLLECTLFEPNPVYTMTARALEAGEVWSVPTQSLEKMLSASPEQLVNWLRYTQTDHLRTQSKLRDLVMNGKKGGVYSTLIRMGNTFGKETEEGLFLEVPLTNQEMANLCGTSREVVNRLLAELKRDGVIKMNRNQITICDVDYLKKEINCENCPVDICQID